ncbi:MAG: hypothetical protein IPN76_08640 [Saprospiraceae bacterium]|nr:hypothetical protein [Saprospiraceae bacterium]
MLFNQRGELSHPFPGQADDGLPWSFTKTQFAGAEAHKSICQLFRYLEEQWFETFEVEDETNYWATGDEQYLRDALGYLEDAITAFSEGFSDAPAKEGETLENRIVGVLQRFWDRRKPPGWKPSGEREV